MNQISLEIGGHYNDRKYNLKEEYPNMDIEYYSNMLTFKNIEEALQLFEESKLCGLRISFKGFKNMEEAKEFSSNFPKYVRMNPHTCGGMKTDENGNYVGYTEYHTGIQVYYKESTMGAKNESSIKRIKSIIRTMKKLNI